MGHYLSRKLCKPSPGEKFVVRGQEYALRGKLGDGAAAIVKRGRRTADGAEFAVKFLAPDPKYIDESAFDDVASRFRREGLRSQELQHRNLVKVHAYEENNNGTAFPKGGPHNPFILMEEVKGTTLERIIRHEEYHAAKANRGDRWDRAECFMVSVERLSTAICIAEALQYLHQKKLVHRDVKPANIFLPEAQRQDGRGVKLGDFGIVKWGEFCASLSTGTLTVTSQSGLGTLKYMSPEQAIAPKDVTVRSDIFSFGITLVELFTGHILQSPHHVFEIMNARISRGNTYSRLAGMGYHIAQEDLGIAELVLDMFSRSPSSRPAIDKIVGCLSVEWERRTDSRW